MALRKSIILWMILTILVISGATILFFGSMIRTMQEESYMQQVVDLARTVALSLDTRRVTRLKEAVQEVYDTAENRVSNEDYELPEYEDYMALLAPLTENEDHLALLDHIRAIQDVNHVDCIYLFYMDAPTESLVYLADAEEEDPCLPGSFDALDGGDYLTLRDPDRGFGPMISNTGAYGWVAGTGRPVYDEDGNLTAYVGVDVSMAEITSQRNRMLLNTALSVLLLTIIFSAISYYTSGYILNKRREPSDAVSGEEEAG